ncbi:MAG: B12-binding domain-containing radical SAM protein [Candidatus Omnitrophica bacterium]|nr:B12-binding domain-containing radical SAM protein [Candidatus Omnitrophota bacterium]
MVDLKQLPKNIYKKKEQDYSEILFLFPSFQEEDFSSFILTYHLGTGYILAYLKKKGIHAKQFIHRGPIDLYTLTEKIMKQKPKIVGFTCYDTNYYYVKLISQLLKKKNSKLTIMAGGPTATFSSELIMRDSSAIDICVRGEGEYTVYGLVKRLRANQDISDIEGITYRSRGRIVQTPDRPLIRGERKGEKLDILPSPYINDIFLSSENFGILTSRGCIFKCVYCNFSAMSRWTVRYHSVERVISELKTIHKRFQSKNEQTESTVVLIHDDTFSLNTERAKQICRRIIEEKINLPLWADTRADRMDRELLSLMYQAGFQEINFGLESASPKVLYTIKKVREHLVNEDNLMPEKRFIEKVRENVKLAKRIGLNPTVSVIIGLPGATIKDDKKTIEFVRQLKLDSYNHNYLRIFPGTELFKTYKSYGLELKQPLSVLPYQTEYAHDVHKIPEMENSRQGFTKRNQMERIMEVITGDYGDLQGDSYPDLLFRNCSLDSRVIEWLKRFIAISSVISFINGYFEDGFAKQNIEKMISSGLPAVNFYLMAPINKRRGNPSNLSFKSGGYELFLATEILTNRREGFSILDSLEFTPFANYSHNHSASLDIKKRGSGNIIFTLSTLDDIENLIRLTPNSEKVVLEGDMAKFDCYFLDECRWSNVDCPAARFRRAIIDNDNSIIPCFNGMPIAKVGNRRENTIENLRLLWEDMKRKRGCDDCSLKDSCSKCLFPYPMSSKQYCQMRHEMYPYIVGINKIFKLLKITRKIKSFNSDLRLKPKFDKIVGVFDNDLVVVNIDKKRYLYNHRFDKLYES